MLEAILWPSLILASSLYLSLQTALTWAWMQISTPIHSSPEQPPFSVIIAARNEADKLPRLLQALSLQTYSDFEVIVVLDRCTDDSQRILTAWTSQHKWLTYLTVYQLPEGWAAKKWALSQGIQKAKHEWLVLTDADCTMSPNWLSSIATHLAESDEVILGLSPYSSEPSLLNRLIRFETWYTAFQYIGWARLGLPYMGVGRNLVYRRSFFKRHDGFEKFKDRLSGDDDLLINAYAQASNTAVMISLESRTSSIPETNWRSWFRQKTRHVSASNAYRWPSKLALGVFHLCHFWFYVGILLSLFLGLANATIGFLYIARIGISWLLFFLVNQRLRESNLLSRFPVLDLLFFLYNLSIVPIGIIKVPSWTK